MTLQQVFDFVNKATYFSRDDDEIWAAISESASTLFLKITAENSGFFLVWDTSSVALAANVEQYSLPSTVGQIVRMRERLSASDPWAVMTPSNLNAPSFVDAQFASALTDSTDAALSTFQYYGPYLLEANAVTAAQAQQIDVQPTPQESRFVEMVFIARFVDITDASSPCAIPNEGLGAVKYDAAATLLATNDDDNSERFRSMADENERWFLKWVRNRQYQQGRQIEAYVDDLD